MSAKATVTLGRIPTCVVGELLLDRVSDVDAEKVGESGEVDEDVSDLCLHCAVLLRCEPATLVGGQPLELGEEFPGLGSKGHREVFGNVELVRDWAALALQSWQESPSASPRRPSNGTRVSWTKAVESHSTVCLTFITPHPLSRYLTIISQGWTKVRTCERSRAKARSPFPPYTLASCSQAGEDVDNN
nr:hypothetical protein [Acidiferrimicrobium sp. IK]